MFYVRAKRRRGESARRRDGDGANRRGGEGARRSTREGSESSRGCTSKFRLLAISHFPVTGLNDENEPS
jgi:hypothetical protein